MKLNELYWRWSPDGSVVYVEYAYQTRFLKRIKIKSVAMFFCDRWETPNGAKIAAENFIKRAKDE